MSRPCHAGHLTPYESALLSEQWWCNGRFIWWWMPVEAWTPFPMTTPTPGEPTGNPPSGGTT